MTENNLPRKEMILKIMGPDEPGLIHKITGTIFYQGLNIVSNKEYVEHENNENIFFMRSHFIGKVQKNTLLSGLEGVLPNTFTIDLKEVKKKKVVVFVSKEHHCLSDILIREKYDKLNCEIQGVISNHEDLKPLAEMFGKEFHYVPTIDKSREEHEKEVLDILENYKFDYLILAKYMRILTGDFVNKYFGQLINIHHSFLPAFIGVNPYEQAFERGVKIIGATAHFVSVDLDQGPIICQEVINIDHSYSAKKMEEAGRDAEEIALAKALNLIFAEKVFIHKNKTIIL